MLGLVSLVEVWGCLDLLYLLDYLVLVGQLNLCVMLMLVFEGCVDYLVYLECDYSVDDMLLEQLCDRLLCGGKSCIVLQFNQLLGNCDKLVGGQLVIDIEWMLNYQGVILCVVMIDDCGCCYLGFEMVCIQMQGVVG